MPSQEGAFWLVWNPQGGCPSYRHQTEVSAHDEAKRLSRVSPGQQFIVLEAKTGYRVQEPLQRVDFIVPPF